MSTVAMPQKYLIVRGTIRVANATATPQRSHVAFVGFARVWSFRLWGLAFGLFCRHEGKFSCFWLERQKVTAFIVARDLMHPSS